MEGSWLANDKNLKVIQRNYKLQKMNYKYDKETKLPNDIPWNELYDPANYGENISAEEYLTDDVLLFNASNTALKKGDIENMYKGDLEIIRNSIYARHGYSFKNRKMRYVFDRIDWYSVITILLDDSYFSE